VVGPSKRTDTERDTFGSDHAMSEPAGH